MGEGKRTTTSRRGEEARAGSLSENVALVLRAPVQLAASEGGLSGCRALFVYDWVDVVWAGADLAGHAWV